MKRLLCDLVRVNNILNEAFGKRWRCCDHGISGPEKSSNTNPKWPEIVAFLNLSVLMWTKRIFQISPTWCGQDFGYSLFYFFNCGVPGN